MMANGLIKDETDIHNRHGNESIAHFKIVKDTDNWVNRKKSPLPWDQTTEGGSNF